MNEFHGPARTVAYSFDGKSWREKLSWVFRHVRLMERIEGGMRSQLEAFARGVAPPDEALASLARMRRACDQLQAEIEAIAKHRGQGKAHG